MAYRFFVLFPFSKEDVITSLSKDDNCLLYPAFVFAYISKTRLRLFLLKIFFLVCLTLF